MIMVNKAYNFEVISCSIISIFNKHFLDTSDEVSQCEHIAAIKTAIPKTHEEVKNECGMDIVCKVPPCVGCTCCGGCAFKI